MTSYDAAYAKYFGPGITQFTEETTEEEIKEIYKDWAADYNKQVQASKLIYHKPLAEFLDAAIMQVFKENKRSQIKIVDVGAGTGLAGVELAKLGYTNIDALDISQEMLNEAKKTNAYTKLICAPLSEQRNPIETGEYHVLISTGTIVIGHVRPEALGEMIRMVKTGGLFCFSMRDPDVKEYEDKMLELEKTGRWQTYSRVKMPFFDNDDLPKETNAFIFKVLKN